jgi:hypothetical protein
MNKFKHAASFLVVRMAVCFGLLLISGCATAPPEGEGPVATLEGEALSSSPPTAEVTTITYMMKALKFHVKLGLKNIYNKAKRFDVTVGVPGGPSAGGFYPIQKEKGEIPSMEPGEELIRVFRLYYEGVPGNITVRVNEA